MIKAHRMFEDGGLSREPSACHVTCKIFLLYENSKPNHCTDQVIFRDQLPPAACTRARSGSGARTPRYPIHTHGRSSPPASARAWFPPYGRRGTHRRRRPRTRRRRAREEGPGPHRGRKRRRTIIHSSYPPSTHAAAGTSHRTPPVGSGGAFPFRPPPTRAAPHRMAGRLAGRAQARAAHVNRRAPGGNGRAEAIKKSRWGCWSSVPCRRRRSAWNSVRLSIRL